MSCDARNHDLFETFEKIEETNKMIEVLVI